ncbi:hypothetical protein GCM10010429_00030 [Micromonospora olivasterospora]
MVAKIHNASNALTGATTSAVSFERIGQSRVFIGPRPEGVAVDGAAPAGHRPAAVAGHRHGRLGQDT